MQCKQRALHQVRIHSTELFLSAISLRSFVDVPKAKTKKRLVTASRGCKPVTVIGRVWT